MESQSLILKWLLDNSSRFNIVIRNNAWANIIGALAFNYTLEIDYKGIKAAGYGIDFYCEEKAIIKAFCELIERYFLVYLGKFNNTNGLAVHYDLQIAKKNALDELIERDAFVYHHLNEIPFLAYTDNELKNFNSKPLQSIKEELSSIGSKLSFYKAITAHNDYSTICLLSGLESSRFGLILGSSYGRPNNIEKSLSEIIYNLNLVLLNDQIKSLTIDEFYKEDRFTPYTHFLLGLNKEYAQLYSSKYFASENYENLKRDCGSMDLNFEVIPVEKLFPGIPVSLVRASSESLIPIEFGPSRVPGLKLLPHPFS